MKIDYKPHIYKLIFMNIVNKWLKAFMEDFRSALRDPYYRAYIIYFIWAIIQLYLAHGDMERQLVELLINKDSLVPIISNLNDETPISEILAEGFKFLSETEPLFKNFLEVSGNLTDSLGAYIEFLSHENSLLRNQYDYVLLKTSSGVSVDVLESVTITVTYNNTIANLINSSSEILLDLVLQEDMQAFYNDCAGYTLYYDLQKLLIDGQMTQIKSFLAENTALINNIKTLDPGATIIERVI